MKLIGSLTEQQLREELIRSNRALQDGTSGRLAGVLASAGIDVAGAYVLNWTPEQFEDIYSVLISINEVLHVEIPRSEGAIQLEREMLASYERDCSKSHRLRIAVARDLLRSKKIGPSR